METQAMTIRLPLDLYERLRREAFEGKTSQNAVIVEELAARYDPDSLSNRILAMAAALRDAGDKESAERIEYLAAQVREAWRGTGYDDTADALGLIADCARELACTASVFTSKDRPRWPLGRTDAKAKESGE